MVSTTTPTRRSVERGSLPTWVKPQLAKLVKQAQDGTDWLHEIKLDGYRMHARLDDERRYRAAEHGAAEFITKPVDFEHLKAQLRQLAAGPD